MTSLKQAVQVPHMGDGLGKPSTPTTWRTMCSFLGAGAIDLTAAVWGCCVNSVSWGATWGCGVLYHNRISLHDWLIHHPSLLWVLPADTSLPHSICSPEVTGAATSTPAICLISRCLSWFQMNCRTNLIWQMGTEPRGQSVYWNKFLQEGKLDFTYWWLREFLAESQKILDTMDFTYPSGIYPWLAQIIKSCLWQHCHLKEYRSPEIQHPDNLQVRQPHLRILSN